MSKKHWSAEVNSKSTFPPDGVFTKNAEHIAKTLASPEVSPKGPVSGLRMLMFYINRAGKNLSPARKAELDRAKALMQKRIAKE